MNCYKKSIFVLLLPILFACSKDDGASTAKQKNSTEQNVSYVESVNSQPTSNRNYYIFASESIMPLAAHNANGNAMEGFEFELLKAIATQEGFTIKGVIRPKKMLLDMLENGESDIIGGGIVVNNKNSQNMDFTQPYAYFNQALLVREENSTILALNNLSDKSVAVTKDTASASFLSSNKSIAAQTFDTPFQVARAVSLGRVEAAVMDAPLASYYSKQDNMRLRVIYLDTQRNTFAFGIKKNREDLQQKLNSGLQKVIRDGTYRDLYVKWFRTEPVW
ncbi:MAG: amino acid ABC transporter substrate-binding protein [Neisseriaceae bacterium]|nr:amino acid ABC transporter substrate-binding protein [Neisseriaceae bacterium]